MNTTDKGHNIQATGGKVVLLRATSIAIMIYHQRTLVSTAGYDQVSGKWKYAATVSWSESGSASPIDSSLPISIIDLSQKRYEYATK